MRYQSPVQPFYPNSVSQDYARRHHNSSHSLRDFLCPRHLSDFCPWRCHFKPLGGVKWLQNPAAQRRETAGCGAEAGGAVFYRMRRKCAGITNGDG